MIKAQYSAAQAQVRIGSALSGISEEMGDVSLAVERAESKTESLKAKAGAIDELVVTGVLDDPGSNTSSLDQQLKHASVSASVEAELAALKGGEEQEDKKALEEGKS